MVRLAVSTSLFFLVFTANVVLAVTNAFSAHLLRPVPEDVAADMRKACEQVWPTSAFEAGRCMDERAAEWLSRQDGDAQQPPPPPVLDEPLLPNLLERQKQ